VAELLGRWPSGRWGLSKPLGEGGDLGSNAVDLYESFMQPDDDPDAPETW
jgi:hypothetical protein